MDERAERRPAAELTELTDRYAEEFPASMPRTMRAEEFTSVVQQTDLPLLIRILLAATGLVLLIVIANVAGLLLARGSALVRSDRRGAVA